MDRYNITYYSTDDIEKADDGKWVKYESIPQWIKCSERMPEDLEKVLIYDGCNVNSAIYVGGWFHDFEGCGWPEITHWMPLPELPTEQQTQSP